MLNQVPGRLGLKLTTPFELVHNSKPDYKTWFELFSIGYSNHDTDKAKSCYKLQVHTLYVTAVGRDDRSNSIIFYNPITSSYYRFPAFRLDESIFPIINFPNSLHFDGGLTCGLIRNNTNPIHDPFGFRRIAYGGDSCVSDDMESLSGCSSVLVILEWEYS